MNFKRLKSFYNKHSYPVLNVKPGQILEIHEKVWDGDSSRIWKFKGMVLKVKKPQHPDGSFTIRGEVARTTIEKIYPLSFEKFEKVLLMDENKVRRSKLYYMRDKVGRWAKMKSIITPERKGIDLWAMAVEEANVANKEMTKEVPKTEATDESGLASPKVKEEKIEESPKVEEVNVEVKEELKETPKTKEEVTD